ncbi:MAG: PepSY domain-containing protein [Methylobacter sp.]|nr:PepSY domain-containing protein [Methylobacter sp.]MDP2100180.1 PepSY domain-containing protein [Methylobacter sp.]MDP2426923.1 PepSY domain-containing protein [Methylobacter sp.]MDP3053641.1 PepSY domain-containing protein [Methylobacter sp.]MDP3360788.1 PepSY domain-containing protein [Methylobacter sp.]
MKMKYQFYLSGLMMLVSATAMADDAAIDACRKAASEIAKGETVKIKLEQKKGLAVYEIEIKDADGSEWEFKCDKASGKIVETERELPSADHPAFAALKKIDEAEARKIALAAHPGTITKVEYEIEADGTPTYEFDIKMEDGRKMEVEVDAATGKIIKAEED